MSVERPPREPDAPRNARDAAGRALCPTCGKPIFQPNTSPYIGAARVHLECWAPRLAATSPYFWRQGEALEPVADEP